MSGRFDEPVDALWDTQLISYAMKGSWQPPSDLAISSVTAQELLNMQRRDGGVRFGFAGFIDRHRLQKFYRRIEVIGRDSLMERKHYGWDQFYVSLPGGGVVMEALHYSVSRLVNDARIDILNLWLSTELDRAKARVARDRFEWLVENGVRCVSLKPEVCQRVEGLWEQFVRSRAPKAQVRNTLNDLLILSQAIDLGLSLYTSDKLLAEFAEHYLAAGAQEIGDRFRIDPESAGEPRTKVFRDRRGSRSSQLHRSRRSGVRRWSGR